MGVDSDDGVPQAAHPTRTRLPEDVVPLIVKVVLPGAAFCPLALCTIPARESTGTINNTRIEKSRLMLIGRVAIDGNLISG